MTKAELRARLEMAWALYTIYARMPQCWDEALYFADRALRLERMLEQEEKRRSAINGEA